MIRASPIVNGAPPLQGPSNYAGCVDSGWGVVSLWAPQCSLTTLTEGGEIFQISNVTEISEVQAQPDARVCYLAAGDPQDLSTHFTAGGKHQRVQILDI